MFYIKRGGELLYQLAYYLPSSKYFFFINSFHKVAITHDRFKSIIFLRKLCPFYQAFSPVRKRSNINTQENEGYVVCRKDPEYHNREFQENPSL